MLPPELVNILLEHLDLYSLVSLAQTCQSWNSAITEAEYRYMLLKSCPFYQLDNSNRLSWRDCATEYLRRNRLNSPKVDSSIIQQLCPNTTIAVRQDELLPPHYYSLCKMQAATRDGWHDDVALRHTDSGFSFQGAFVSLKGSEGVTNEDYHYDNGTISSRFGIKMGFQRGQRQHAILAIKTNTKCIAAIVCYEPSEYRILVKYIDSHGIAPNIDFGENTDDWLYSVGFCPSTLTSFDLFLVESCIFVYVQQQGHTGALLALNNGVMERVLFNDKYMLTSTPEMLCVFDGKIAMAGKHVMPEFMRYLFNRTPVHATNISQDPVYSNYVGLYNAAGSMTHLIDFATQSIVDITAFYYTSLQAGFLALPGLVDGQLVVYRYSQQFLLTHFGEQVDVQVMMTKINCLVDAPESMLLPHVPQTRVPARSRAVNRHKTRRRVVV
ncbi:YALI0B17908p [Yarrowia lipolytica CLIB122]|jgi:hypothetical protein|uniref:YALI0B17908p n=2 Tax=Yarrowia lipolytica TaxID=4952 RepID=Q6CE76_YARLI|nr:YALI0B17908p [Yarrowia lipolytica CLIB122]AOW01859.1 hypothetical protein YALI1_B23201g [Yarrowia lipolytica]KAB8280807.1 hypothetical protein BKA91DRAFT_141316 [Yarrowia lipolytica]KAE8170047.1 hypothetical protein BKA90DRAFT_141554 [Yarrowia lipolytica]KAJ8052650.1 hypothetical protein LXG23DRAFT_50635 [Yarrowia lipolytica]RMJ01391.1 hypothetical protein BD777DRAFT_122261 [Yarrowia lipolytica]|eukprot:XP_501036.1 YALI0B17908p [Yarrowia lipolytica CLIB122]